MDSKVGGDAGMGKSGVDGGVDMSGDAWMDGGVSMSGGGMGMGRPKMGGDIKANEPSMNGKAGDFAAKLGNDDLMRQMVDLQQQVVNNQRESLAMVLERRVTIYAVLLLVSAGVFSMWFFTIISSNSIVRMFTSSESELLVHDHVIMPIMALLMIAAAVMLMLKKYMARLMVGVAMGSAVLWNIVATIHGFVVDAARDDSIYSLLPSGGSELTQTAVVLAITRFVIGMLFVAGMTLWFFKSESIQKVINGWRR